MRKLILSWAFMGTALALGITANVLLGYDQGKVILYFMLPYYAVAWAMQYVWPEKPNQFEKNEVITDLLNNAGFLALTALQAGVIQWMSDSGKGLLFQSGLISGSFAADQLPFWAQVMVAWLVFDFMFYVTHRIAHEVDFFWRFHSVHHCAHRLSFLNASRVHPIDITWRRLLPLFVAYQTGVSAEAMFVANTIGSVLAVITHMNVDFRFGVLNYVIGTNEMHRWHHSNKIEEAKNYSVLMLWDHLFGTFVYQPQGQQRPEKMGLFNELYYPVQNFWGQMLIPFTWKRWKARQALAAEQVQADGAPAVGGRPLDEAPQHAV